MWLQTSKAYQPATVSPTVRENEGRSKEGMRLSNDSFTILGVFMFKRGINDDIAWVKDSSNSSFSLETDSEMTNGIHETRMQNGRRKATRTVKRERDETCLTE